MSSICWRNGVAPPRDRAAVLLDAGDAFAGDQTSISTEVLPATHGMSKAQIAQ